MKLPPQIVLAPDYVVQVKLVSQAEIDGAEGIGEPTEGYWDKDDMTIYLSKDVGEGEQLYTLLHEQVHAALDCMDFHLASWKAKAKSLPKRRKRKSHPANNPANLVPVRGVGVTAGLTVDSPPLTPHSPEGTHKK